MNNIKIAIATYKDYMPPHAAWIDDLSLRDRLVFYGCNADLIDWQDDSLCPFIYDKIFVSTTWNIPGAFIEFKKWLAYCESDGVKRIINSSAAIDFSINKDFYYKYFEKFIPENITPTLFFYDDKNNSFDFLGVCDDVDLWNNSDLVIKPIVSSDGKNTFIYKRDNGRNIKADKQHVCNSRKELQALYDLIISNINDHKGVMIQPYLHGIDIGEYSITYIKGRLVLCIKKPGGFKNSLSKKRIAIDIEDIDPELIALSNQISNILFQKFDQDALIRFRLDFIKNSNRYLLSEIELAEPNCNFSVTKQSANEYDHESLVDGLAQSILSCLSVNHNENMRA